MNLQLGQQLVDGAVRAPLSIGRMRGKTIGWFVAYLSLCAGVLALVGWTVLANREALREALLGYLFPDSWHWAAGFAVDRFLAQQEMTVLITAVTTGALMMTTLLLFPVKEFLSASFETEARLVDEPVVEHPLLMQGWEEVKLFVFWLAVQMQIFWIGYHPGAWREVVAVGVGYAFLFFTFAIDFASPVFQRHKGLYSQILKTLAAHPVASLSFGAVFAAPPIVAGRLWEANPHWSVTTAVIVVFAANVASIAWAAVAGTWLGSRMMADFSRRRPSGWPARIIGWTIVLALLVFNSYRFGALVLSLHHKSQILKCDYSVDLGSFGVETPSLTALLDDRVDVGVHFDVVIENPTEFDVEIEKNRVELVHGGDRVGTTKLSPVRVASGEKVVQRVALTLSVKPSMLRKGLDLIEPEAWEATLYLEVAPGFEFPVYLLRPGGG